MRLGIFVTHPIQYFAPLWRELGTTPGLDVVVHFFSDHSLRGGLDKGFNVNVTWDVPVLEGYEHRFLRRDGDRLPPAKLRIEDPRKVLTEGRFDVVMFHGYTHGFERQLGSESGRLGIRTIMRGEFTDLPQFQWQSRAPLLRLRALGRYIFLRRFYRHIDAFACIGEDARGHLLRHGVPPNRIFFSPYSVDTKLFERQRGMFDRARCRRELGIGEDQFVLLFSGKLVPRKDPMLLLRALEAPDMDPGLRERITVLVVGDGELKEQVTQRGRALLGERLNMAGFVNQSQIGRYFVASDALVLPSHHETWGLVVNEAMQFGLPVIVSDHVRCHLDLVPDGRTGVVFRDGDERALARAIARLAGDRELAARMGREAEDLIRRYSTSASAEGIRRAIAFVMASKPGEGRVADVSDAR